MSDVPVQWVRRQLGDVARTALGKMLDKGKHRGHAMVPYLRNTNVQWGRIEVHDLLAMELADNERDRFGLADGDMLVCEGGEIGRAAIWNGGPGFMAYQKALHRVRTGPDLDNRFLLHQWRHAATTGALESLSTGSTIKHLPQQQLRKVPILVPPIAEQRRIVDILEDHLSRLDAADRSVEFAERRAALLEAALLTRAVSSGMDESTLGELALSSGYGTSTKCVLRGPGPAVVRIPNVSNRRIDLTDEKRVANAAIDVSSTMLSAGDLLIVRTNGSRALIGRSAVVDEGIEASFASYLIRYQLDRNRVRPEWVSLMLSRPETRGVLERLAASSAGQYNLSLSKLDGVGVPAPRLEEQDRVILEHSDRAENLQRLRVSAAAARSRSAALRRALLAAAFSGKLTGATSDAELIEELADER